MKMTVASFVGIMGVTLAAQARLTDDQVAAAIKAGHDGKLGALVSGCIAGAGFGERVAADLDGGMQRTGSYSVVVSTHVGQIARRAAQMKALYKPFAVADVGDDLRLPSVVVDVVPIEPDGIKVAALIEHVVLKTKGNNPTVAQPSRIDREPMFWTNLLGAKIDGNRATAVFDYAAVRELPAGEFDVVIVTPNGERRCKVGNDDRKRLFK